MTIMNCVGKYKIQYNAIIKTDEKRRNRFGLICTNAFGKNSAVIKTNKVEIVV